MGELKKKEKKFTYIVVVGNICPHQDMAGGRKKWKG
jgi:hypothetical protein